MNVLGVNNLESAVMQRNGEVYDLIGELLGECSACDLHMAMSLISKLKAFGLNAPSSSVVIQPEAIMEKRQRRRRRCELSLHRIGHVRLEVGAIEGVHGLWNDLPTDLVLKIADKVGDDDRQVMACACASWKQVLGSNTRTLSFQWAGRRTVDLMTGLSAVNQVCNGAAAIYTQLESVNFRRCELLSSEALENFAQRSCHCLKEIDLSGCSLLTDDSIQTLAGNCPDLKKLHIASCQLLTDVSFEAIGANCPQLNELGACGCDKISDNGLIKLSQGTRLLQRVNLGWCEALTSLGILSLAENCRGLKSVDLCGCLQVDDEGISGLAARCRGLESLGLHCCRRLTDASPLALAAHLKHLSNLNISGCRVLSPEAVQMVLDSNPRLHTCGGFNRNVIVAGCLNLLAVSCSCPGSANSWRSSFVQDFAA